MIHRIRRIRILTLVGAGALTVGRGADLWWHATHDEFETGADQLQAHWLPWLGALIMFATALVAIRQPSLRSPGFAVVLGSASLYAALAVWHFWLHQQLRDPDLPHVLLAVSQLGLFFLTSARS